MVAADAMPTYDAKADTNDVAILTLQAPGLTFTSHVDAIGLVPSGAAPVPGRALDVSGYGTTAYQGPSTATLQATTVNEVDDDTLRERLRDHLARRPRARTSSCAPARRAGTPARATAAARWSRCGATPLLVGIVNSGIGCADSRFPGIYAEVADPAINTFLAGRSAPSPTSRVRLELHQPPGGAGDRLQPGHVDGVARVRLPLPLPGRHPAGPERRFDLHAPARRPREHGVLRGRGDGQRRRGHGQLGPDRPRDGRPRRRGPRAGRPRARPRPRAGPAPAPNPLVTPAATVDRTAPTAKILSAHCVGRRCSLRIRVSDRGFSAGIRRPEGHAHHDVQHDLQAQGAPPAGVQALRAAHPQGPPGGQEHDVDRRGPARALRAPALHDRRAGPRGQPPEAGHDQDPHGEGQGQVVPQALQALQALEDVRQAPLGTGPRPRPRDLQRAWTRC